MHGKRENYLYLDFILNTMKISKSIYSVADCINTFDIDFHVIGIR